MKKVVINNMRWYVDEVVGMVYENSDKTGASFPVRYPHLTAQERIQLSDQLYYNQ